MIHDVAGCKAFGERLFHLLYSHLIMVMLDLSNVFIFFA